MGAVAFRGQDPVLSAIVMKLALLFAPKGALLSAMHIGSVNYALANTLSRLAKGAVLPPRLAKVLRSDPSRDGFYILGNTVELPPGWYGWPGARGRRRWRPVRVPCVAHVVLHSVALGVLGRLWSPEPSCTCCASTCRAGRSWLHLSCGRLRP